MKPLVEFEREAAAAVGAHIPWVRTSAVEVLKSKKSFVYRFQGDRGHPNVIAKMARHDTLQIEHVIYRDLLAPAPVSTVRTFGLVAAERAGYAWLLLEDADGMPYDPSDADHRAAAAAWLAKLHVWASAVPALHRLPDRGADYHRSVVEQARSIVALARANPAVPADDVAVLVAIEDQCARVCRHWEAFARVLRRIPTTLAHNGFAGKNVHVRPSVEGSPPAIMPFDWEAGGRGHPAADLSMVDLDVYHDAVGPSWTQLDSTALGAVAGVGQVLWNLAPIPGERASLAGEWPHRALGKLHYYKTQVEGALGRLSEQLASV